MADESEQNTTSTEESVGDEDSWVTEPRLDPNLSPQERERLALKKRAQAVPIYGHGEIPADRLVDPGDIPSGSIEVIKLFFRSWPFIRPQFLGYWHYLGKGRDTEVADLVSDGEYHFYWAVFLFLAVAIVPHFLGWLPDFVGLQFYLIYTPVTLACISIFAMAGTRELPDIQLICTAALITSLLALIIMTMFVTSETSVKIYSGFLVASALLGWAVQMKFERRSVDNKTIIRFRVREQTHLVYFYLISFMQRILGWGFALLNADLLNQALLQGEPLAPRISGLLGFPELSTEYLESLTAEDQMALLYRWVVINLGYFFFMLPINVGMGYYNMWIMQMINQNLREALVERWHQLSLTYHSDHRTGDSIFRIYQDSAMVTNVIRMLVELSLRLFNYVGTVGVIAVLSPLIAFVAGVVLIPAFVLGSIAMPRVRSRSLTYRAAASAVTSTVQETFSSIRVIKAFNASERAQNQLEEDSLISFNAAYRIRNLIAAITIIMFTLAASVMITGEFTMAFWAKDAVPVYWEEIIKLIGLTFVVWNLAAFDYTRREFRTSANILRGLLRDWMTCQDMAMGLKRVFDILDIEPDIVDKPDAVPLTKFEDEIRFEGVSFSYTPERPVLRDVSFSAKAGTITAIIGPTGSGKSSLMALLLRMFDPATGKISVDGRDIKDLQVESLRSSISIALQENVLFALSVRDNILYVAPGADDAQVNEAIRVAAMDDYVESLPEGIDTILSDRGGKISSGQKQRLSIARAVVRDTPILVLDEPTAALDAETELRVLSNLSEWGKERAIFLITHRISTIRRADNILYLDEGRIVESGSHDELMQIEDGAYRAFVEAEINLTDTTRQLSS